MARTIKAWSNAKTQAETKQHVDNVAKAHGEPTTMLQVDWTTLLDRFKEKYGEHLHDNRLPSQSYYEAFEEKLSDGQLTAETLAHVVSLQEELDQKAKHPEPTRQLGLHLDSSLTIQTKRRYMSHNAVIDRTTQTAVQSHDAYVAVGADEATDKAVVQ